MPETNACGSAWGKREDRNHCNYCGSLSPADAVVLLAKTGTHYSGSDWKYGHPHKFYLGQYKFYTSHLMDATEDQLVLFNRLAEKTIGITFKVKDGKLIYAAPCSGYQAAGTVGGVKVIG